jgi:hypothetical protein
MIGLIDSMLLDRILDCFQGYDVKFASLELYLDSARYK